MPREANSGSVGGLVDCYAGTHPGKVLTPGAFSCHAQPPTPEAAIFFCSCIVNHVLCCVPCPNHLSREFLSHPDKLPPPFRLRCDVIYAKKTAFQFVSMTMPLDFPANWSSNQHKLQSPSYPAPPPIRTPHSFGRRFAKRVEVGERVWLANEFVALS